MNNKLFHLYLTYVNDYPRFKKSRDYTWIIITALCG